MAIYFGNKKVSKSDVSLDLNDKEVNVSFKDGSPKGVVATVSELPSGGDTGIYIVKADNYWYWWNGSSWQRGDVYTAETNQLSNGAVFSANAHYAEVGMWSGPFSVGVGYFVSVVSYQNGIPIINRATPTSDVRGVSVAKPAFVAGVTPDKLTDGVLKSQYGYIGFAGVVNVIDNGKCTVDGVLVSRCMPDFGGTAKPSDNNMGYQIISRVDANTIKIIVEPSADMIQRIKTDMEDVKYAIGFYDGFIYNNGSDSICYDHDLTVKGRDEADDREIANVGYVKHKTQAIEDRFLNENSLPKLLEYENMELVNLIDNNAWERGIINPDTGKPNINTSAAYNTSNFIRCFKDTYYYYGQERHGLTSWTYFFDLDTKEKLSDVSLIKDSTNANIFSVTKDCYMRLTRLNQPGDLICIASKDRKVFDEIDFSTATFEYNPKLKEKGTSVTQKNITFDNSVEVYTIESLNTKSLVGGIYSTEEIEVRTEAGAYLRSFSLVSAYRKKGLAKVAILRGLNDVLFIGEDIPVDETGLIDIEPNKYKVFNGNRIYVQAVTEDDGKSLLTYDGTIEPGTAGYIEGSIYDLRQYQKHPWGIRLGYTIQLESVEKSQEVNLISQKTMMNKALIDSFKETQEQKNSTIFNLISVNRENASHYYNTNASNIRRKQMVKVYSTTDFEGWDKANWTSLGDGGIKSTTTNTAYNNMTFFSDSRLYQLRVVVGSDSCFYVKFAKSDDTSTSQDGTSVYKIDLVAKKISVYPSSSTYYNGINYNGTPIVSDINFEVVSNREYLINAIREKMNFRLEFVDTITGNKAVIEHSGWVYGRQLTKIGCAYISGTHITLKKLDCYCVKKPYMTILGDSITEGYTSGDSDYTIPYRYAQRIYEQIGDVEICALSGCGIDEIINQIQNELLKTKPQNIMVTIGTNGGLNRNPKWKYEQLINLCYDNDINLIINHIPKTSDNKSIDINNMLDTLSIDPTYGSKFTLGCKFDLATTYNGALDTETYISDKLHPNDEGHTRMYGRMEIDLPELFTIHN